MTERGRRPPSSKQAEVLEYVAYFGRVQTAFPNLRQTADVSRAERNQTKGRSKTLPPRRWG